MKNLTVKLLTTLFIIFSILFFVYYDKNEHLEITSSNNSITISHLGDDFPMFSWPPPQASTFAQIPITFFYREIISSQYKLSNFDELLTSALRRAGYVELSYFYVPGGFALVTRLEKINPDGSPKQADRWSIELETLNQFSLSEYLKSLFFAKEGFYRVIVFVISSVPFNQSDEEVSRSEAMSWLRSGLNRLPPSIGNKEYTEEVTTFALIYEFEVKEDEAPKLIVPGKLTGRTHLENSGVLVNLGD